MRIGILTHPQAINYGGILQCFALSSYLEKMGHHILVIRRYPDFPFWRRTATRIVDGLGIRKYLRQEKVDKAANINTFIEKNLKRTKPLLSQNEIRRFCKYNTLDAVIVGSDQVWRADFALKYGYNYFLDFVPKGIKKLAYAASFGLNTWQYTLEQTQQIKNLLTSFDGISVREHEAVELCKVNIGLDVFQMPDPTLLLSSVDYDKVTSPRLVEGQYVYVYWLGEKSQIHDEIVKYQTKGYEVIYVGLREQRVLPSVEDWLSYIKNAHVVITDSFHGCVFSMIFHKNVYVFSNNSGGNGRIASLFQQFGIKNSFVSENDYAIISPVYTSFQTKAKDFFNGILK